MAFSVNFCVPLHPHPQRKVPPHKGHLHAHCSIQGPTDWCLSLRQRPDAYLLTPIPGGPHTGINLAETVPPNVKLGPDLVHHSAQFCQRWVCRRDGDGAVWPHQPDSHVTRVRNNKNVRLSPSGIHPLHAPPLHNGSPWLETNWVRIREQAACPASWAQSSVCCS